MRVGEAPKDESETFLVEIENLGYEATGKPKAGSEIQDAVNAVSCRYFVVSAEEGYRRGVAQDAENGWV